LCFSGITSRPHRIEKGVERRRNGTRSAGRSCGHPGQHAGPELHPLPRRAGEFRVAGQRAELLLPEVEKLLGQFFRVDFFCFAIVCHGHTIKALSPDRQTPVCLPDWRQCCGLCCAARFLLQSKNRSLTLKAILGGKTRRRASLTPGGDNRKGP